MLEERPWKRPLGDVAAIVSIGAFWAAHDNWIVQLLCALLIAGLVADLIVALRPRRGVTEPVAPAVISLSPGDDLKLDVGLGVLDIHINDHRYRAEYDEDGESAGEAMAAVQAELRAGRTITDLNAFLGPTLVFRAMSR
ncbi:hypothetical protein [Paractinoplanes atraurantiacus]|uniref:Uncharacterized protein n=1 Tax=Paractinoplanes atraurantiacus TaxID=1036182 RepID=A0A285H3Z4_9ACTN|nr:hypothetical protein [Actinoplanes atraurantiacus]SNY30283.1 hypothetical protein SAMN05421748_103377 [Actinoplanes atraurantiacus]